MIRVPDKRDARSWVENVVRAVVCRRLGHTWQGWLAPPMPRLGRPRWLFRCERCGGEVVRYSDGREWWLPVSLFRKGGSFS